MDRKRLRAILTLVSCAAIMGPLLDAQHGAPASGEWPTYGGDLGNARYSPLDQINEQNFARLQPILALEVG